MKSQQMQRLKIYAVILLIWIATIIVLDDAPMGHLIFGSVGITFLVSCILAVVVPTFIMVMGTNAVKFFVGYMATVHSYRATNMLGFIGITILHVFGINMLTHIAWFPQVSLVGQFIYSIGSIIIGMMVLLD